MLYDIHTMTKPIHNVHIAPTTKKNMYKPNHQSLQRITFKITQHLILAGKENSDRRGVYQHEN